MSVGGDFPTLEEMRGGGRLLIRAHFSEYHKFYSSNLFLKYLLPGLTLTSSSPPEFSRRTCTVSTNYKRYRTFLHISQ